MESSDDEQVVIKQKKKVSLIASDDDSEPEGEAKAGKAVSNDDDDDGIPSDAEPETNVSSSIKKKRATFADSSSDSESEVKVTTKDLFSNKNLYDAEESEGEAKKGSDSSSCSDSEHEASEIAKIEAAAKKSNAKPKKRQDRKTKAAALQEIYSESQRMFRESGIKVAYHRPKQRTLDEFLSRKKRHVIDEVIGNDIKLRSMPTNTEEVQRKLEECEKLTEEFYKSEDEDNEADDEECEQPPQGPLLEPNPSETIASSQPTEKETSLASSQQKDVDDSGIVPNATAAGESGANSEEEKVEDNRELHQEESLKLFLEPESEKVISDEEVIPNSQKPEIEKTLSEKETPLLSKKLQAFSKEYDLSQIQEKLTLKPSLAKQPGGDIILEEGSEEKAMKDFLERFSKHAKANGALPAMNAPKKNLDITIVRKERDKEGVEHLKAETINYKVDLRNVSKAKSAERPGAQLIELKKTLKEQIFERRRAERLQRQQLVAEQEEQDGDDADGEEEEEVILDDEVETDEEESSGESEPPEEDPDLFVKSEKKFKRVKSAFLDDEAEEDGNKSEDDEEGMQLTLNDEDSRGNYDGFATPSLVSGRTVSKISDKDPETPFSSFMGNDNDPRWTPFDKRSDEDSKTDKDSAQNARKKLGFESLFDQSDPQVAEIDDVVGLCSGQFVTQQPIIDPTQGDDSQAIVQDTPDTVLMTPRVTQNGDSQMLSDDDEDKENNVSNPAALSSLLESDDDEENTVSNSSKKGKKTKRLVLSDDESDGDNNGNKESETAESEAEEEDENNDDVMYDSEENEVETPVFKGFVGKKGIRKEFLENEAELSGSDAGSDDEDERGLDRMLVEEGDFDNLDEDEVRDAVGRIHHRQVLDEDKRELRLFQEAFLEDGELHSDNVRARKFRWKNIDKDNLDLSLRKSDSENEQEEDELEEKRRLDRLERERWLQENEAKKKPFEVEKDDTEDSRFFKVANKALDKLNERAMRQQRSDLVTKKPFKSPDGKMPLSVLSGNLKGSFLRRESGTLEKLAEMTKNKSGSKVGATAKNTNNFVFATKSPSKMVESGYNSMSAAKPTSHKKGPPRKKAKTDRSLNSASNNSIFGLLE